MTNENQNQEEQEVKEMIDELVRKAKNCIRTIS